MVLTMVPWSDTADPEMTVKRYFNEGAIGTSISGCRLLCHLEVSGGR